MDDKIIRGNYFKIDGGSYCGVIVPEDVMKKIVKLQFKYNEELKNLLANNEEKLISYSWGLVYPDGKQTSFNYIDSHSEVKRRIKYAQIAIEPQKVQLLVNSADHDEAHRIADDYFNKMPPNTEPEKPLF